MDGSSTAERDMGYAPSSRLMEYAVGGCAMPEDDPSSAGSFRYAHDADIYCLAEGDGEGSRSSVMA